VAILSRNGFLIGLSTVPTTLPVATLPRDDGRTRTLTLALALAGGVRSGGAPGNPSGLGGNPFGILTFIVAPAILTNASSVMALGTSNRFARAIDRARALSAQVEGKENDPDPEIALRIRQLRVAETRVLLLVRALTAFYLSVGSFAAATLVSLLGAVLFFAQNEILHQFGLVVAFCAGGVGVVSLVTGSGLLVGETRMALRILSDETDFMLKRVRPNSKAQ
jgi:hypothetical protein